MTAEVPDLGDAWPKLRLTALGMTRGRGRYLRSLVKGDPKRRYSSGKMEKVGSRTFVEVIEQMNDYAVFHLHPPDRSTVSAHQAKHDERGQQYSPHLQLSLQMQGSESSPLSRLEHCVFGTHNGSNTTEAVLRASASTVDNQLEELRS
jgi:hypothetical protein